LSSQNGEICLQKYLAISGRPSITNYLKQNAVDYLSYLTIENTLKVEKKIFYFENKHNSTQKTLGVRVATNVPKHYAGTLPGRCLLHHKGSENEQTIFFHVTAGNVKFAVSQ